MQACTELGIADWPRLIRRGLTESEKRTHARQLNLARRHLDLATRRQLIEQELLENPARSNRQIAGDLGINHETVGAVRGGLEATGEIRQLDRTIGADGKSRPTRPIRTTFIDDSDDGRREAVARAREVRAEIIEERRGERLERIEGISRGNTPLLTPRRYPVIYADPPWRYEHASESRAVENHYPTMELPEICALPVADIAADDALLFLWSPAPMLAQALEVVDAWGFTYRTTLTWWKQGSFGMGHYARIETEHLLIARRGDMPPPAPPNRPRSLIIAKPGRHSEKPAETYGIIERAYPGMGKIELFARSARGGWDAWGNQAPDRAT